MAAKESSIIRGKTGKAYRIKLPDSVKKDWLVFMVDSDSGVMPDNHFDFLLKFLKTQEEILERLEQLGVMKKSMKLHKMDRKSSSKCASTRTTKMENGGAEKHKDRIYFCKKLKGMKLSEKKATV